MKFVLTSLFSLLLAVPFTARAEVRHSVNVVPATLVTASTTAVTAAQIRVMNPRERARIMARERAYHLVKPRPWRAVRIAISWLLVVLVVGFAVISYAGDKVEIVVNTVRDGVGKSIGSGLLGHLAIIPGAVGVVILLGATIIGILLIPLGLIAYMLTLAGIAMFGFIAVALLTGAALTGKKSRDETPRGAMLRAFVTGTLAFLGMWIVAAAFTWMPLVGAMLRSLAAGATFIAVTTGFGAVLRSYWRGDFKRAS